MKDGSFLACMAYFYQEAADATSGAMVSIIGLDSGKVQLLCDAANEEVDDNNKVQIANFLCPVRYLLLSWVSCFLVMLIWTFLFEIALIMITF